MKTILGYRPEEVVYISTDTTRDFADETLWWKLCVPWAKVIAVTQRELILDLKAAWVKIVWAREKHKPWHVSFASSFIWKEHWDKINYEEVINWTDKKNWLTQLAWFKVIDLKKYLKRVKTQDLWVNHSEEWTLWVEYMPPLTRDLFDVEVIKWTDVCADAYSAFNWTNLDETLHEMWIKCVLGWGLLEEICASAKLLDARKLGYEAHMIPETTMSLFPDLREIRYQEMMNAWVKYTTIDQLFATLK